VLKITFSRNIMNYINFHKQLKLFPIFSLNDILKIEPTFHRRRLNEWQNKRYIKKIIRGYYLFADKDLNESILFAIANKIYTPSYISFEMALSYYNLIPESVYSVTCATSNKTSTFDTPVGSFIYKKIKPSLMFGYKIINDNGAIFRIGEPEKVILDYFYINTQLKTEDDFSSLRINCQEFKEQINLRKLMEYLEVFKNKTLTRRINLFLSFINKEEIATY